SALGVQFSTPQMQISVLGMPTISAVVYAAGIRPSLRSGSVFLFSVRHGSHLPGVQNSPPHIWHDGESSRRSGSLRLSYVQCTRIPNQMQAQRASEIRIVILIVGT